jgi:3-methyladenine DNA glycosylase Tag
MQAGLSWETVLARRDRYREAFSNFEITYVAAFDDGDLERMMNDAGLIRNRQKLRSALQNAKAALAIVSEFGSLRKYFGTTWTANRSFAIRRASAACSIPLLSPRRSRKISRNVASASSAHG